MRNNPPGSVLAAISDAVEAFGGVKKVAEALGLSASNVSRSYSGEEDRPGGMGSKYLDTLARVTPRAADPIADHFARLGGGVYIPLPSGGPICSDVHRLTKEFSDVLQHHAEAHSTRSSDPNDYTPQEARRAAQETLELMQAAASYFSALQERFER